MAYENKIFITNHAVYRIEYTRARFKILLPHFWRKITLLTCSVVEIAQNVFHPILTIKGQKKTPFVSNFMSTSMKDASNIH